MALRRFNKRNDTIDRSASSMFLSHNSRGYRLNEGKGGGVSSLCNMCERLSP